MKKLVVGNGEERYEDLTPEELETLLVAPEPVNNWLHPYPKRIEAPLGLAFEPSYVVFLSYCASILKLPIEKIGENVHIYCNYIAPHDLELIKNDPRITVRHRSGETSDFEGENDGENENLG